MVDYYQLTEIDYCMPERSIGSEKTGKFEDTLLPLWIGNRKRETLRIRLMRNKKSVNWRIQFNC